MHDTSSDSGLASNPSISGTIPPPAPPPPPSNISALNQNNSNKKWQIKVEETTTDKAKPIIKSSISTGHASGEVEVPRPQSVAELRAQIATKLEVKNPAGQSVAPISPKEATTSPANPAIVHQPTRPQHGKLTPSVSLLSLDRIHTNNNIDDTDIRSNLSSTISPMASTSARQYNTDYSPISFHGLFIELLRL